MVGRYTLDGATAAVNNPATKPADLAVIARDFPSLRPAVAVHPNVYPDLLDWLRQYGDDDVKQAVDGRDGDAGATQLAGAAVVDAGTAETVMAPQLAGGYFDPEATTVAGQAPAYSGPTTGASKYTPGMTSMGVGPGGIPPTYGPYPGMMPMYGRRPRGMPLLIGVGVVVVALVVAAILWGIPGTGFHGVLKSGGGSSSHPVGEPAKASYAFGYKKTWTVTAASLGITQDQLGYGVSVDDVNVLPLAESDTTWLLGVDNPAGGPVMYLYGVDAATGAKKWGEVFNGPVARVCAPDAIDGVFYCGQADEGVFAVDPDTGKMTKLANPFSVGSIVQTTAGQVSISEPICAQCLSLEVVDGYILATAPFDNYMSGLVSLISPAGKVMWTIQPPDYCGPEEETPPDVGMGGLVIINDGCGAYVFDVKTGNMLVRASGSLGFVSEKRLWLGYGSADRESFTDSSGGQWTIGDGSSQGSHWMGFASPDSVAPLTSTISDETCIVSWVEADGSTRWLSNFGSSENGEPGYACSFQSTFDGQSLILNEAGGYTWALSPKDGTILWRNSVDASQLAGSGHLYYVLPGDGTVVIPVNDWVAAFNGSTGVKYWSMREMWLSKVSRNVTSISMVGSARNISGPSAVYRIDPAMPQPRVPSMPASLPSCPDGWTPVSWSTWDGGHTLVCSGAGTLYYVVIVIGSQKYEDYGATSIPTGGYSASFSGNRSAVISLGGGLIQFTQGKKTTSYLASQSWYQGASGGFKTTPSGIPPCPKGSYPLSLSIWQGQWLLTCGTAPDVVTAFFYFNGSSTLQGKGMTSQGGMSCGTDSKGQTVCVGPGKVTVTKNGKTDTFTPESGYGAGLGGYDKPPAGMPECASSNWSYGGSYPDTAAYGKWQDASGGVNWLLICQGSSGYGIVRGGSWADDQVTFFEVNESSLGVFMTNFSGGDLNGVTVSMSPDGTYQVTGGSSSHLGATQGWQPLLEGYFPHGGGGSSGTPGGQPTESSDAATQQVLNLQSLVWQNAYVRPSLTSYIQVCDVSGIANVLQLRQDFLAAVQASAVDKIPNGYQLQSVLENAIQYSIQSDQSYLTWAQRGCPRPVPVLQSDTNAGNAKDQFVAMWNSTIAGRYPGAQQLTTSQL